MRGSPGQPGRRSRRGDGWPGRAPWRQAGRSPCLPSRGSPQAVRKNDRRGAVRPRGSTVVSRDRGVARRDASGSRFRVGVHSLRLAHPLRQGCSTALRGPHMHPTILSLALQGLQRTTGPATGGGLTLSEGPDPRLAHGRRRGARRRGLRHRLRVPQAAAEDREAARVAARAAGGRRPAPRREAPARRRPLLRPDLRPRPRREGRVPRRGARPRGDRARSQGARGRAQPGLPSAPRERARAPARRPRSGGARGARRRHSARPRPGRAPARRADHDPSRAGRRRPGRAHFRGRPARGHSARRSHDEFVA